MSFLLLKLTCLTLIPKNIHQKLPSVHKYVGYAIITLLTLGNIAIAIISPISMGGNDLSLTAVIIVLSALTSVAMGLAWYNIRKQQIDEHRKWMLRAMFWMGIIVTMRVIMFVVILAVSYTGGYNTVSAFAPQKQWPTI